MSNRRGIRAFYLRGDTQKSVTEILQDPNVQNYVKGESYASTRESLQRLLRNGEITPEHVGRNPALQSQVQDTLYGSQRRKVNLPKKDVRERVLFGPEPAPKPRRLRGSITINGEKLTAKRTLEKYPKLREHLLRNNPNIKDSTLRAKLRKAFRNGDIPNNTANPELEIVWVQGRRLLGNTVAHFEINN